VCGQRAYSLIWPRVILSAFGGARACGGASLDLKEYTAGRSVGDVCRNASIDKGIVQVASAMAG
jgi:hypothetical protein